MPLRIAYAACLLVSLVAAHSEYLPYFTRLIREADQARARPGFHGRHAVRQNPGSEDQYFQNVFKVSNGGTNAEAYWSFDNKKLTFQAQLAPYNTTHPCDLVYNVDITGKNNHLVSPAYGRDTCSYFTPNGTNIIYSSTMAGGKWCPAPPDQDFGYTWPLNKDMDIYTHDLATNKYRPLLPNFPVCIMLLGSHSHCISVLTRQSGYTAESTVSPDGRRIVFTSDFEGDLELYTMDLDGGNLERMTYTPGCTVDLVCVLTADDGGAYFSYDSKMLVWRANRPQGLSLTRYLELLSLGIVEPTHMQLYIMQLEVATPHNTV